jgi:hypothetical protein
MAIKPFALILCLHAAVHHVANSDPYIDNRRYRRLYQLDKIPKVLLVALLYFYDLYVSHVLYFRTPFPFYKAAQWCRQTLTYVTVSATGTKENN